jgi:hypothetical protein
MRFEQYNNTTASLCVCKQRVKDFLFLLFTMERPFEIQFCSGLE